MKDQPHIISTRKLPAHLINQLHEAGVEVTHHDFLKKIIHLPPDNIIVQPAIAITSRVAAEAFVSIKAELNLDPSNHRIYCLIETQAFLKGEGVSVTGCGRNALDLASKIANDPTHKEVTFFCGDRRRPELPDTLRANNIKVDEVEVYATHLTPVKINKPTQGILFFSPSGIDSFLSCNKITEAQCFCIGDTTAQHAQQAGFTEIITTAKPSVQAVVEEACMYYSNFIMND